MAWTGLTIATGIRTALLAMLAILLAGVAVPATAQIPGIPTGATSPEETPYDGLIQAARDGGATVIVIEPGQDTATPGAGEAPMIFRVGDILVAVRQAFRSVLLDSGDFLSDAVETIRAAAPETPGLGWLGATILFTVIAVAAGVAAQRLVRAWARGYFVHLFHPEPEARTEKIGYLLFRAMLQLVGAVVIFGVGMAVFLAIAPGHGPTRAFGVITLGIIATVFALRAVFMNVLAPDAPSHRMIALSDAGAEGLFRALVAVFILSGSIFGLCVWLDVIGFPKAPHLLMLISTTGISAIALSVVAILYRRDVAGAILAIGGDDPGVVLRVIAALWHVLVVVYFIAAWLIGSARLLLDVPTSFWLVFGPALAMMAALGAYGLLLILIDRWFAPRDDDDRPAPRHVTFKPIAERAAALFVGIGLLLAVLRLWGVHPLNNASEFRWLVDMAIVIGLAYLAYAAAKLWIDSRIAEEDPGAGDGSLDMEEMQGQGVSRLATLLPIFRSVLLAGIVAIAGMMVLAELGVDIAPLFAGAGIIGIAIGFGAQTLVRDIFSGAFFLIDDAFRKGEYIDIGGVKGTVERISMRSFQLRHHNGPLHTVPFGEIKQLTNYSRDWVMMKLPLRVTYDTDVEKVRKLIKKLGQQLLEDPEIGDKFLQPLKSQGVFQMEDSAMIIRVKFMTKPGDQFVVRRHVYTRIRELFEREGIEFAHRQVTVRLADEDTSRELTPKQKEALGAAVAPIVEEELAAAQQPAASGASDR